MRKILLLIFIVVSAVNLGYSQKKFINKEFEFEILEPKNWIESPNKDLAKNIELNEEYVSKVMAKYRGNISLASFYKYDRKTHPGIIPTIQINVINKGRNDFKEFKQLITQSANGFKNHYADFEFVKEITEIEIAGIKCVYFIGKFTMKTKNGQEMKVRSRTYAIPYKNYFFQLNFSDEQIGEDCTKEFEDLIKTIRIGANK